ncbi:hypothetical protein SERLA73DRAFT_78756 [Serpula lacrymans var. lacrymans S7.3]|uniref:DUF6532 domain-containing protein n=2 Tax=Serpula lacrymans var. lacrymans TaxID=341189 RepID=F8QE86_SERL3|nr:uncharacterized protein SERLADRAFT_443808 [Serpula lacrymans var. lacrymans S7.9]EGN93461.1 hypothetical protein SERLA73DRAFT_78756 [Serpula lacrymans var. lacrymans S7.3]EGO18839.1 hypothetical protein SERLADRAFT_443808 [Serpula lacrymans var. lacrymans S7.9]
MDSDHGSDEDDFQGIVTQKAPTGDNDEYYEDEDEKARAENFDDGGKDGPILDEQPNFRPIIGHEKAKSLVYSSSSSFSRKSSTLSSRMSSTSTSISTPTAVSLLLKIGKRRRITLDMFPSSLVDLATAGHTTMRLYIATQEGSPPPISRFKFTWNRLINASQGCRELQTKLLEVQSNEEIKTILIDYVWSAVAQVQGEIVAKACIIINGAYQIPGDMAPVQIKQAVMWLLETGAFADGDLNIKARTFNKQKPFCHQVLKDLIYNQGYGRKGEGVYYPEHFKGIPLALLVITTVAIKCSLRGYVNGNKATQEFSESVFKTRWEYYFKKLLVLQKKSPVWMKQMRDGLYQDILNLANLHYLGIDEDQMKDEDFGIDFEALKVIIIAQAA